MKKILILKYTVLLLILPNMLFSENTELIGFPKNIEYKIQPFYKYRLEGKPGREVKLIFKDSKLPAKSKLQINYGDKQENYSSY